MRKNQVTQKKREDNKNPRIISYVRATTKQKKIGKKYCVLTDFEGLCI